MPEPSYPGDTSVAAQPRAAATPTPNAAAPTPNAAPVRDDAPVGSTADPHQLADLRTACRHLVRRPLVLAEREPDIFMLVRRHEHVLDRWFTQRFGYRVQVTADTARLHKPMVVPDRRPLFTVTTPRPMTGREYTLLALALAATAAGPEVISLRDLLHEIRSAATDAGIALTTEPIDRRAVVAALKWMIADGLVTEAHERIDRYADDEQADAVLRVRADRIALLPLSPLANATTAEELLDRSAQRRSTRAWMRSLLLEESVLYRSDLTDDEWAELRRRLGEEAAIFAEMFDVTIEVRAEGIAVIDDTGTFTDVGFPRTGTVGHAALLLVDWWSTHDVEQTVEQLRDTIVGFAAEHRRHWSRLVDEPDKLCAHALDLLHDHRLVEPGDDGTWHLRPAAARFALDVTVVEPSADADEPAQGTLL